MLRDGQFIKEPPIKIGAHYVPFQQQSVSKEEAFVQDLMLHGTDIQQMATTRSAKIVDALMFVLLVWIGIATIVPVMKFILDYVL